MLHFEQVDLLIHVRFIHSKMAVIHKDKNHYNAQLNSFLRVQKSFLCACKSLFLFSLGIVILRKSMKN